MKNNWTEYNILASAAGHIIQMCNNAPSIVAKRKHGHPTNQSTTVTVCSSRGGNEIQSDGERMNERENVRKKWVFSRQNDDQNNMISVASRNQTTREKKIMPKTLIEIYAIRLTIASQWASACVNGKKERKKEKAAQHNPQNENCGRFRC